MCYLELQPVHNLDNKFPSSPGGRRRAVCQYLNKRFN